MERFVDWSFMDYLRKTSNVSFVPRLSIESSSAGETLGFLHINRFVEKIKIGAAMGREFRLVQCLFSPQNNLYTKYNPVAQTHERAFSAIRLKSDSLDVLLNHPETAESKMADILEKSIRKLRRGDIANHLTFVSEGRILRMEIARLGK